MTGTKQIAKLAMTAALLATQLTAALMKWPDGSV